MPRPRCASAALSHHWLVRHRGGERVLRALRELLPAAPVYTFLFDPEYTAGPEFRLGPGDRAEVHASLLHELPAATQNYPKMLPLMPAAARLLPLPPVDLVVCSDAALAKAFPVAEHTRLVCYCHSPMRYAWDLAGQYAGEVPALLRPAWPALTAWLRAVDRRAAQRVDLFIANSQHVARRIQANYGRCAEVVYPPVAVPAHAPPDTHRDDFYLSVGHHVAYKRLDLAIEACARLGRRLVVIGETPQAGQRAPAGPPGVSFLGRQPDHVIADHFARARALLFPGEEDFGIVPVEAQGHGCPVIAYGIGGAAETVLDRETGLLFREQNADALCRAILDFEQLSFDPRRLHSQARRFEPGVFARGMARWLELD